MDSMTLQGLEREYTRSQINWKRSLTDVDMKRRKADKRERDRMQIRIIDKIASPTLSFELENFKLFGKLKKTETEIHNTVPTLETVTAEKDYINFDRMRKSQPQEAKYTNLYGCIQNEVSKPRTPRTPTSYAYSGIETPTRGKSRGTPQYVVTPSRRNSHEHIGSTPTHLFGGSSRRNSTASRLRDATDTPKIHYATHRIHNT